MIWCNIYKELSARIMDMRKILDNMEDLSPELAEELAAVPDVRYIDLWHEQIDYLEEEHLFPTPSVFIGFNTLEISDVGILAQDIDLQIDLYVFWETFSDTYNDAVMQEDALNYLNLLTLLGMMLHGKSGTHFGTLRRTHVGRVESGGAGNLYRISFECKIRDYTTMEQSSQVDMKNKEISVSAGTVPEIIDNNPLYDV